MTYALCLFLSFLFTACMRPHFAETRLPNDYAPSLPQVPGPAWWGRRCAGSSEYRRTINANDPEYFSLCWARRSQCDAGNSTPERNSALGLAKNKDASDEHSAEKGVHQVGWRWWLLFSYYYFLKRQKFKRRKQTNETMCSASLSPLLLQRKCPKDCWLFTKD